MSTLDADRLPVKASAAPAVLPDEEAATSRALAQLEPNSSRRGYIAAAIVVILCWLIAEVTHRFGLSETNIVMIFLGGVALIAARFGRGPAALTAVLNAALFDFCFVYPFNAFSPSDVQYLVTLAVMLGIGMLISTRTTKLQAQLRESQQQEHRTAQLYRMTRQLSTQAGSEFLVRTAGRQLTEIFPGEVALFFRDADGRIQLHSGMETSIARDPFNAEVAQWVVENNQSAGLGTGMHSAAAALFVPLVGSQATLGVLGVRPQDQRAYDREQLKMLETCASLIALSIQRDRLLMEAHQAQMQVQAEQLRNSLLSSVSHDLRTPLATIAINASSLLDEASEHTWAAKREMLQTVVDESHRLNRQVVNLLGMAQLNSGTIVLNREWNVLEELVGVVLRRLRRELRDRRIQVNIPDDFPLLWVAGDLIEQVLSNLIENAIRYTPAGSAIEINARCRGDFVEIVTADHGLGLPPGTESKLFDKFFRGTTTVVADGQRGIGLGLAICKGIVEVHGGQIRAANRVGGGAEFLIRLPCPPHSPQVTLDESSLPTGAA